MPAVLPETYRDLFGKVCSTSPLFWLDADIIFAASNFQDSFNFLSAACWPECSSRTQRWALHCMLKAAFALSSACLRQMSYVLVILCLPYGITSFGQ